MSNGSLVLIRQAESPLARVGKKIEIANKLLAISNDNKFIDFFLNHPELITMIQLNYSLSEELLSKWRWNWYGLSNNPNLNWTEEFIEKYADKWNWYCLSKNGGIKWSENLILKFEEKNLISLSDFSGSSAIKWTESLIDKYNNIHEWYWDWRALSSNPSLPWSIKFFEKYFDKWDWSCDGLSSNKNLPWSIHFIDKYKDNWDWHLLSRNEGLPWSIDLIEYFLPNWDYLGLIGNNGIPENLNPIVKMVNLKSNGKSQEFEAYAKTFKNINYWIDNYKNTAIDDNWYELSKNKHLIWTSEILQFYQLNWKDGLSSNRWLQWSIEFIETYKHMWDYRNLAWNMQVWTSVFKPYINDKLVNEVMSRYEQKQK